MPKRKRSPSIYYLSSSKYRSSQRPLKKRRATSSIMNYFIGTFIIEGSNNSKEIHK